MDRQFWHQVILLFTIGFQGLLLGKFIDSVEKRIKETVKTECSAK